MRQIHTSVDDTPSKNTHSGTNNIHFICIYVLFAFPLKNNTYTAWLRDLLRWTQHQPAIRLLVVPEGLGFAFSLDHQKPLVLGRKKLSHEKYISDGFHVRLKGCFFKTSQGVQVLSNHFIRNILKAFRFSCHSSNFRQIFLNGLRIMVQLGQAPTFQKNFHVWKREFLHFKTEKTNLDQAVCSSAHGNYLLVCNFDPKDAEKLFFLSWNFHGLSAIKRIGIDNCGVSSGHQTM